VNAPLSFQPDKTEFDQVSIEAYNTMSEEYQFAQKELEETQEELMRALSFAPRSDFKAVGKKLSGLKRRLRELDEKLEEIS